MKRHSILSPRDISVFYMLQLHPALSAKQLSELCFDDVSYETARKRLRRLHQSGYMGTKTIGRKKDKGRPESVYFLNAKAAQALANSKNIPEKTISIGAPNIKHHEYLLRLAQLHLSWQHTAKKEKWLSYSFTTKRILKLSEETANSTTKENPDATLTFTNKSNTQHTILLVLETGNLRPTRHWIPKITALLKTNLPILIITTTRHRLDTLRKWTLPLLEEANLPYDRCLFMQFDEIVKYSFLSICAYSTTGSAMKIPA